MAVTLTMVTALPLGSAAATAAVKVVRKVVESVTPWTVCVACR